MADDPVHERFMARYSGGKNGLHTKTPLGFYADGWKDGQESARAEAERLLTLNGAVAGENERLRETLETAADHLTGVRWYLRSIHADQMAEGVGEIMQTIEAALAAAADQPEPGAPRGA